MAVEVDVPVFKKCCFCIPLRHGLLIWGYLKLFSNLFLILTLGTTFMVLKMTSEYQALLVLMLIFVINFLFTIVFLVGAHRKHEKLLRVYYKFCIVILILTATVVAGVVICQVKAIASSGEHYHAILFNTFARNLTVYLFDMTVQGYLLMLIRSELLKLRDSHNFEFVNNAASASAGAGADASCNMVLSITEKKGLI